MAIYTTIHELPDLCSDASTYTPSSNHIIAIDDEVEDDVWETTKTSILKMLTGSGFDAKSLKTAKIKIGENGRIDVVVGNETYTFVPVESKLEIGGVLKRAYVLAWVDYGVQLWENGPYWAECNVGASAPEEYGYYFWWGDTVGYKRNAANNGWVSVKNGSSFSFETGNCPTFGKDNDELESAGYINSTGDLVAAYDAATVHLGAPWRMPTDAELDALISNCTTTWTTRNDVYGRLVTGKGAYSSRSIFLPAAGYGNGSDLYDPGSDGYYWSSAPISANLYYAWCLLFNSGNFTRSYSDRDGGQSVRPVRDFAS